MGRMGHVGRDGRVRFPHTTHDAYATHAPVALRYNT
jgi:hypothetical protein